MKKRFLIFALSLLIICGFILARDFYVINKRKTLHEDDCCSSCWKDGICLDVCLPCCDKYNNVWNVILLKKKYYRMKENCHYF